MMHQRQRRTAGAGMRSQQHTPHTRVSAKGFQRLCSAAKDIARPEPCPQALFCTTLLLNTRLELFITLGTIHLTASKRETLAHNLHTMGASRPIKVPLIFGLLLMAAKSGYAAGVLGSISWLAGSGPTQFINNTDSDTAVALSQTSIAMNVLAKALTNLTSGAVRGSNLNTVTRVVRCYASALANYTGGNSGSFKQTLTEVLRNSSCLVNITTYVRCPTSISTVLTSRVVTTTAGRTSAACAATPQPGISLVVGLLLVLHWSPFRC